MTVLRLALFAGSLGIAFFACGPQKPASPPESDSDEQTPGSAEGGDGGSEEPGDVDPPPPPPIPMTR